VIASEIDSSAAPATIHELLVDVDAWSVWSPHVASIETVNGRRVHSGWTGRTRAVFSPGATSMIVDEVRPDGGYTWHSTVGPWRLEYHNAVVPADGGSTLRFAAELCGPAAGLIERLVAPLSAFGQRRRMARLARMAELIERHAE
jgi:hypothetical protein